MHLPHRSCWPVLIFPVLFGCRETAAPDSPLSPAEDSALTGYTATLRDTLVPRMDFTQANAQLRAAVVHGTCAEWKVRGDSLHEAYLQASARLERMRNALDARPMNGSRTADSLFIADGEGDLLYRDLSRFYRLTLRSAADRTALSHVGSLAGQVLSFPNAGAWRAQCFTGLPRVVTSTILSKISTDMVLLENTCLHSILKACERSEGPVPFPKDSV